MKGDGGAMGKTLDDLLARATTDLTPTGVELTEEMFVETMAAAVGIDVPLLEAAKAWVKALAQIEGDG